MSNGEAGTARRQTGPALEAMYRFLLWLVPTVEKFPRGCPSFKRVAATRGHAHGDACTRRVLKLHAL
jgi:hypothetical protein